MTRYRSVFLFYFVAAVAGFAGACGTEVDDRPATLDYITVAILRPACGTAACHSSLSETGGFAFDTVEATQKFLSQENNTVLVVPGDLERSKLWRVLVGKNLRMPPSGAIPDKDIALIENWILDGGKSK